MPDSPEDAPPPIPARNLDSQLLRRTTARIHNIADYLADALQADYRGEVSVIDAPTYLDRAIGEITGCFNDLDSLRRHAYRQVEALAYYNDKDHR